MTINHKNHQAYSDAQVTGFAPHIHTVRATAYRCAREVGVLNKFIDATETAWYDC
jgi:hypothetical protein